MRQAAQCRPRYQRPDQQTTGFVRTLAVADSGRTLRLIAAIPATAVALLTSIASPAPPSVLSIYAYY